MGAQSIKIPVQLEIQQLQGSINYIKKALDKLDPGTNLYKSLEKGLTKVIHQMNALEVESKQSFGSVKEIENFEKNFNKVGTSVQELGNLLNKVSFSDLGKIFSKNDLQPIEDAKDEIKNLQQSISKIKTDKMFELTRGSKEFEESISSVGANTFEKAVKGIETQVGLLTKKINDAEASITGFKNTLENEMELSKTFNKVSSIDAIKNNFFTAFKNSKGEESHRFKAGGKNQLLALLQGMGLTESEIGDTTKLAYDNIDKFYNNISKKIEQKIKKQNDAVKKAQTTYDAALTQQDTRLQTRENYNSALAQLRDIEVDPTVLAAIEQMNTAIEEQEQKIIELQKQLLIASGVQEAAAKATVESAEANEKQAKTSKEAADAAREQAKAQELLSDIKFAIKNWFGFNEVINLTKNAVRNMITQIRELDDVMTQIAIVTDMTQQELWDQMDTYSAMAQQYGASIKGVYEVSQLYYQQGLQTAEVMNLTEETLKMAKIANLDYAEATDYMTVALRGFKLEMSDAQQVTDVYSALAAATASDTEELAVAMSKTASSAEAVGSSFESTSAMIATMISITREAPENIGSALKSIISRYGEMTSDPMKLVDSEGEEMSLNKVDKALQSVGISLQDAQGQFRDFDDVILELSKSWDTIDTNTQRYIATVMAGNRQQSRFLALVGNYEEYAKALEVAENAEDAGTLQTLKTMDSISTKWEQLKVSLQEFYTSAGLEDVFKGVLDALTAFLTKANDIPKLFGKIPVSVFALVGSLITSIKSVATSLTSAVVGPISDFSNKLDEVKNKSPLEIKVVAKADVSSVDTAVNQLNNAVQQRSPIITGQTTSLDVNKRQALQNYFNDLDNNQNQNLIELEKYSGIKDANKLLEYSKQLKNLTKEQREALLSGKSLDEVLGKLPKTLTNTTSSTSKFSAVTSKVKGVFGKYSSAIGMATSALSAYLLTLKDSSSASVEASKTSSGLVNTLAGIGRIWGGDYIGGIMQLISGIPTLIDGLFYTTEEKLKNATEKATGLSNEALQKKSDYKNLKNEISELEKLTSARYDSTEAMQEYLDYSNQMADKYPELIDYIDSEGNAVLDLSDKYNVLEQSRLAAAEAAAKSAMAELETSKINVQKENETQADYLYQNLDIIRSNINDGFATYTEETRDNIDQQFSEIFEKAIGEEAFEKFKEEEIQNLQSLFEAGRGENFLSQLENDYSAKDLKFKTDYGASDVFADISASIAEGYYGSDGNGTSQTKNLIKDDIEKYASETTKNLLLGALEGVNLENPEEVNELMNSLLGAESELISLTNITDEIGGQLSIDTLNFINSLLEMIPDIKANERAIKLAESQQRVADNQALSTATYWKGQELLTGDNKSSYRVLDEMSTANKIIDDYLKEKQGDLSFDDYYNDVEKFDADYTAVTEQLADLWNNLLATGKSDELNQIIGDLGSYSENNLREALNNIGVTDEEDINLIISSWEENYSNAFENFKKARKEQITKLSESSGKHITGGASLGDLAPKYYASILEQFAFINSQVEKNIIKANQGQIYANNLTSLWEKAETDLKFGDLLQEADLTSLSGIYDFRQAIIDAGYSINDFDAELSALAANIKINVVTETDSLISKLNTSLKTFSEEIAKAGEGMDLEEALKVAEKLDMSIADFKFEDGEFKMEGEPNFQKLYDAYVGKNDELQQQLKNEIEAEINRIRTTIQDGTATKEDLDNLETLKILSSNLDKIVGDYNKQLLQTFLLQNKSYQEYFNNLFADKQISEADTNELVAAAHQGEQEFRNLLTQKGLEMTNASVEAFMGTIEGTYDDIIGIINEGKGLVSLTEFDWSPEDSLNTSDSQAVQEFYQKLFAGNHEKFNEAWIGYLENQEVKAGVAIADIASSLDSIDIGAIGELANSLNTEITNILGYFHLEDDGSYTSSENEIRALMQQFNVQTTAKIEDALKEYLNNIISIVSNGIEGSMTNVEFESLSEFFDGRLALEFTETSEGLKLTKASVIEVYTELKKIDSIQAQITFSDLAESLEEAGSGYEDVSSTMKTIAELNRKLADVPVSSERRAELERELAVAEEILRVRSQDPDSFSFMDKDLPTGMQGPENYWNSVGEAYKVMNESAKSGYMEIQDYVNIVNQMEAMAIAAGQEFSIGGMNAAQLIEKGMSSLKNIDGEGVKIAMEGVGIDFANAATDMGLSFDDGIKEVAKSQIKMLDAAIRVLEAMVALEELDIDGSGMLEMDEIFVDGDPGQGFTRGAKDWLKNINLACGDIKIGGKTLEETMLALAKTNPDKFLEFINQMTNIDWTLGDTNVAAQIESLINTFFPGEVVSMDKSIFDILEVPLDADKNLKDFEDWAEKTGLTIDKAENLHQWLTKGYDITQGTPYYDAIKNLLGLEKGSKLETEFDNAYSFLTQKGMKTTDIIQLWDEITVSDGTEGTKYTYNGITYDTLDDVLVAKQLKETEGISGEVSNTTTDATTGEITSNLSLGQTTITVTQSESETIYRSADGACESTDLRKVIDYEVYQKTKETPGMSRVEAYAEFGIDLTAEGLANVSVKGIKEALSAPELQKKVNEQTGEITVTIDGENITFAAGTTDEQIRQKLMEAIGIDAAQMETIVTAISTAISTANWAPVGDAIATALKTNIGQGESGVEAIEIGELTLKPTTLKIDTTGIQPTLGDNLAGTAEAPIGIGDIGVVSGTASELKITSIPSEGTYSPEGEGSAGKITITGGISNAEGEVSTITLIPVAGATSSVSGDIPAADVTTVTINGTTYTVDVSQGTQTNTTMGLTGVKAGSATVEATSYTVTFTNANGTTQTITVQGQAQLTAVLTGATQENGVWKIPNVTTEADVSISGTSKSALETFFDTLVDKLKNIEVSVTPAEKPVAANPQTPDSYNASVNLTNGGTQTFSNESYDGLISAIQGLISTGTANEGTYTIEKVDANGAVIESTTVTVDSNSATVTGQETKTPSDGGSKSTSVAPTTPKTSGGEAPALDTSVLVAAFQAIGTAATSAATNISTATTSLTSIDTSPITTAASRVWSLISAMNGITADAANRVRNLASAMNSIPTGTKNLSLKVSVSASGAGSGSVTGNYKILKSGNVALAKGTGSALTKGTLMGELGPELVVADGRYFTVGNNGAEFVDLPDDAIVFNHIQTQKLLGSSRGMVGTGKPVTNEKKATSLATGNVSGPAMASASAALAQLRQIRAMWQSMLNASAQDLGSLAGAGAGGGGGGGGGGDEVAAVLGDLDRWYNLLRQIDSLEQHITLEQAKRANMKSGYDIVKSMEKELDMLKKQKAAYEELAKRQKEYYDLRRQDLLNSDYSNIFTYDEHGLMQYVEGEGKGLDILATLNATDANGKAKMNAKQQLAYLQSIGFDTSVLATNADGTKAKKPEDQMQNFWDGIDGWMEEMDSLYDSYHDAATSAEEAAEAMAEILQEYIDNQLEVEQKLMQAIEDREQAEIDRIQDEKDALEEASQAYIDGLNDALSKEKDMYSKNKDAEETARLQRRLAILQRSGGSTSEIKSLQEQIDSRMQDEYFNKMQEEIDAIQEASDNQLEKLQNQIDIMTESLEYQKENGLLWQEVYTMMAEWSPEQMLAFIEQYTQSYQQNSQTQNEQDSQETQTQLEIWDAYQEQQNNPENSEEEEEEEQRHAAQDSIDSYIEDLNNQETTHSENFKTANVTAAENEYKGANDAYTTAEQDYIDAVHQFGKNSDKAKKAKKALDKARKARDAAKAKLEAAKKQENFNNTQNVNAQKAATISSNQSAIQDKYDSVYSATEGTEEEKAAAAQAAAEEYMDALQSQIVPIKSTVYYSDKKTRKAGAWKNSEGKETKGKLPEGMAVKIIGVNKNEGASIIKGSFTDPYGVSRVGYFKTSGIQDWNNLNKDNALIKKLGTLYDNGYVPVFKQGGLVDFTGPAWVDGTKSKPEAFLSASDTAMLKSKIFSNSDGSLKSLVAALEKITSDTSHYSAETNSEQVIIQNAQVNIEPGVIANDYDAKRAGEMALEEMIKIARKAGNRTISR